MPLDVVSLPQERVDTGKTLLSTWRTVVWNDSVNLMEYVTEVFIHHFGYPRSTCESLMMQVHCEGRAVVSTGMRERMEADVVAMHSHGLRATLEPDE